MRARAIGLASSRLTSELVSDERLVARLREGDRRAFEAIYDRYERPIRSFCRHMVGQPEDADDAAQHVFLSAYRSIVHTTKPIDLRPWLFTIARNRCRSLLRARYRAQAFSESTEYEPSIEGLGVQVERREQLTELLRDIARLPEDQRAALLLAQLGTLRHSEVAQVLEVPSDKVKALIFQARSSLLASQIARETPCCDIREQLTTQTGAALRRSNLRRHLRDCAGCRDFEARLKHQRSAMLTLLPVAGAPAIRSAIVSHAASGGAGAAGAGGALGGIALKMIAMQAATAVGVAAAGAGAVVVASRIDHAYLGARRHPGGEGDPSRRRHDLRPFHRLATVERCARRPLQVGSDSDDEPTPRPSPRSGRRHLARRGAGPGGPRTNRHHARQDRHGESSRDQRPAGRASRGQRRRQGEG